MAADPQSLTLTQQLREYIYQSEESAARQEYLRKARTYWDQYRTGTGIPDEEFKANPDWERPPSRVNLMHKTVETGVSVFLKNIPRPMPEAYKPQDYDLVRAQRKHIEYGLEVGVFLEVARRTLRNTLITGMDVWHTGWDAHNVRTYGNGEAHFKAMPREDVFLDPLPGLVNIQDSRFCILRFWMPQDTILEMFGQKAADALGIRTGRGRPPSRGGSASRFGNLDENQVSRQISGESEQEEQNFERFFDKEGGLYPVYECWYKPSTWTVQQIAGGEKLFKPDSPLGRVGWLIGGELVKGPQENPFRKYRNRPHIVESAGRNVVGGTDFPPNTLASPTPLGFPLGPQESRRIPVGHGEFPVIRQVAYDLEDAHGRPGLYQVQGVLEQVESSQWDVNDMYRQFIANAKFLGNPPTVGREGAVKSAGGLRNHPLYPGEHIEVEASFPGTLQEAFHVPQMPSVPTHLVMALQMAREDIAGISGFKDFVAGDVAGQMGTSHTTEGATDLISTASFAMMWTLLQNTERAWTDLVKQLAGLQQQFYKVGRYTNLTVNGQQIFTEWTSRNATAEFRYKVMSGSTTPLQDLERLRNVMWAYQMVVPVIQSRDPEQMRITIAAMESAEQPWSDEIVQILRNTLEETLRQQQLAQQSAVLLAAAQTGGAPLAGPAQAAPDGLDALASELGITADELAAQLAA